MKIICSQCHKDMGEQEPFKDSSYVQAKCSDCLAKEKAMSSEALKDMAKMKPGECVEIEFQHGYKGVVVPAQDFPEKMTFFDLIVAGRKFYCAKDRREDFQKYLNVLPEGDVEMAFLFSSAIPLYESPQQKGFPVEESQDTAKGVDSYCVVSVPKWLVLRTYDKNAEKSDSVCGLLAKLLVKQFIKDGFRPDETATK